MSSGPRRTEQRNPRTRDIDTWTSSRAIAALLEEDAHAVAAAAACADDLGRLVDAAVDRVGSGGRIHYFGAGASGRLALLDATEATPTFGAEPGFFTAHFPGGTEAFVDSGLDYEDDTELGLSDSADVRDVDVVIGISASGGTGYVAGALSGAKRAGALTALITSNADGPLAPLADIVVAPDTGPEAITGSTRLKAGTATKVLVNAFSSTLMVRLGRTYSNLMVDLVVTNDKLQKRAVQILRMATDADEARAESALSGAGGVVPVALVSLLTGLPTDAAAARLAEAGSVRAAADGATR